MVKGDGEGGNRASVVAPPCKDDGIRPTNVNLPIRVRKYRWNRIDPIHFRTELALDRFEQSARLDVATRGHNCRHKVCARLDRRSADGRILRNGAVRTRRPQRRHANLPSGHQSRVVFGRRGAEGRGVVACRCLRKSRPRQGITAVRMPATTLIRCGRGSCGAGCVCTRRSCPNSKSGPKSAACPHPKRLHDCRDCDLHTRCNAPECHARLGRSTTCDEPSGFFCRMNGLWVTKSEAGLNAVVVHVPVSGSRRGACRDARVRTVSDRTPPAASEWPQARASAD